jgi:hypothetical protein
MKQPEARAHAIIRFASDRLANASSEYKRTYRPEISTDIDRAMQGAIYSNTRFAMACISFAVRIRAKGGIGRCN